MPFFRTAQRISSSDQVNTGVITSDDILDGTIATGDVADDAITYAKSQNVSATKRALGRNTTGAGIIEEVTAEQLLNWIASSAQGDILYRNATDWVRLPIGTASQFLKVNSGATAPEWAAGSSSAYTLFVFPQSDRACDGNPTSYAQFHDVAAFNTTEPGGTEIWAAGKVKNLRIALTSGGTGNYTFTVRKNAVDTGIALTINEPSGTSYYEETATEVTVAEEDTMTIKATTPGAGTVTVHHLSLDFIPD